MSPECGWPLEAKDDPWSTASKETESLVRGVQGTIRTT